MDKGASDSSANSLTSLETAKVALEKGLISQTDFQGIKEGFIAAQKIRAGIDAKLVKEEDYEQCRDAFFELLGIKSSIQKLSSVKKPVASQSQSTAVHSHAKISTSAPPVQKPTPKAPVRTSPSPPNIRPKLKPVNADKAPPPPPPKPLVSKDSANNSKPVSMSGISVDSAAVEEFIKMRSRSIYLWMTFMINDAGTEVILAQTGNQDSNFYEFCTSLPEDECRYAVYDFFYEASEQRSFQKIVFLNWAPDTARVKQKMMFASTKDFFKGILDGLQVEMHCTDHDELTEDNVREAVKATLTRA